VFVTESCASGVLISRKRFVCGPVNDGGRVFYTYDVAANPPVRIATSDPHSYNGAPMRRVPGTDDFVTVTTHLTPSDFYLYHVMNDGKTVFISESPYHGDFAATETFAFNGSPATHLIQVAGVMLKIYNAECDPGIHPYTNGCFVKDGVLGTLRSGESFAGMTDDGAGSLFGIVSRTGIYSDPPCINGCAVQRIDVATRTITSQKTHTFTSMRYGGDIVMAPDSRCRNVIVGYGVFDPNDPFTAQGFRLESFDY
jgi:hypothetical protein